MPLICRFYINIEEMNALIKEGKIEEVIENNGKIIFEGLGFPKEYNIMLMSMWRKLKDNRLRR